MDIQDLGAMGELISAIAVVVSLFYLAFQIRSNTKAVQGKSYQDLLVLFQGLNSYAYDPEFQDVLDRFLFISPELSNNEIQRASQFFNNILRNMQHAHLQYLRGNISDLQWDMLSGGFRRYSHTPGFVKLWSKHKPRFERIDPAYADWISKALDT